jgi:TPP-dependent pyruvate/acetoin dehydrogenase alpha subunit
MGTNAEVMTGVALSFKLRREPRVALTFIGDGATKTAAFHEGANMAAVMGLPIVFVIQDNQVALGTRREAHGAGTSGDWATAYGIPSWHADGNNVLDTYAAARLAADRCRRGEGPALIVAETFRMGGHATHDEREARETFPAELFEHWGRRDPVGLFEAYLLETGASAESLAEIEADVTAEMDRAADEALDSRNRLPSPERAKYVGFSEGGPLTGIEKRPI